MEKYKIERINELAKAAKTRELSEQELKERDDLRKEFIDGYRDNLKGLLGNITIVDN